MQRWQINRTMSISSCREHDEGSSSREAGDSVTASNTSSGSNGVQRLIFLSVYAVRSAAAQWQSCAIAQHGACMLGVLLALLKTQKEVKV
jgi:hypothetical protein